MEWAQLEAFVRISQEKSFSRAADRMFRTQPAISLAMKRLEKELDEPLFDRSKKTGTLTEAGRILLSYAQRLLNLREEAVAAVADFKGMHRGRLTIGANESTSLYLLPALLMAFHKKHPEIKVEVNRWVSERIPTEVLERNLDVGFLSFDPFTHGLQSFVVYSDLLALVVSPRHRLAKRRNVSVKDLGAERFIAHNVPTPSRAQIFELFAEHRTPLNISIEMATLETIKAFVAEGAGAAILPRLSVRDALEDGRLVEVPVRGMKIEKATRIVFRREEGLSHAAKAFLAIVREHPPVVVARATRRRVPRSGIRFSGEGHRTGFE